LILTYRIDAPSSVAVATPLVRASAIIVAAATNVVVASATTIVVVDADDVFAAYGDFSRGQILLAGSNIDLKSHQEYRRSLGSEACPEDSGRGGNPGTGSYVGICLVLPEGSTLS
jgi:hypothetical protein